MEKLHHSANQQLQPPIFWKKKILSIDGSSSLAFVYINFHSLHPHIVHPFLVCVKYSFVH